MSIFILVLPHHVTSTIKTIILMVHINEGEHYNYNYVFCSSGVFDIKVNVYGHTI